MHQGGLGVRVRESRHRIFVSYGVVIELSSQETANVANNRFFTIFVHAQDKPPTHD